MKIILKPFFILAMFCAGALCGPVRASAQATDAALPNGPLPTSNSTLPDSPLHTPQSPHHSAESPSQREVTWGTLPKSFLQDQKAIWLFPTQLARGHYWLPTLAVAGGTAGLIVADPHVMPYFRSHAGNLDDVNDSFSAYITTAEVAAVPVGFMIAGYARHDSYQVSTALLAGMAYADTAVVDLAIKAISRRERPSDVPPGQPFTNTFFNGGKSPLRGSAFPSGHAAGAFSVATVVATRYKKHRWVPWVMYGAAGAISFSRVTNSAHFPSDVFLGAALGYTITRFQVLRPQ